MPSKTVISELPDNCLYYLFDNYLDFRSKLNAQRVCTLWRQLIHLTLNNNRCLIITDYALNASRIHDLNLSHKRVSLLRISSLPMSDRSEAKDRLFIAKALKKYHKLETLCVCLKLTKCSTNFLSLIAQNCCESLRHLRLELSECSMNGRTVYITHEEVSELSQNLPQLTYLYIDYLILHVSEYSLNRLFTQWPQIETIVFHSHCFRGTVVDSEPENGITSSRFSGNYFGTEEGPVLTQLVKLEMPGNIFNKNVIHRLSGQQSALKRLFVTKINQNCVEMICEKFPTLISFGFSVENHCNDEDLYYLMENCGKCTHLTQLYVAIQSGVHINYNCIKFLRSLKRLKTLQLDQTLINKGAVDGIVRYLPHIQCLELWTSGQHQNFHNFLTDDIVLNVKRLKYLTKLNLRGQRSISDATIASIISQCLLLETLDVRTTKAAIETMGALVKLMDGTDKVIHAFVNESPIARLLSEHNFKRFELCKGLILCNEDYDCKVDF